MAQPPGQLIERLGSDGLARVLADLLDKNRLSRLATSCGLKYPGVRVRSVKRDKLVQDLVARAEAEETTREAIVRTLDKEMRAETRRWNQLSGENKAARVGDDAFLGTRGNLGKHLWLLARSEDNDANGFTIVALQRLSALVQHGSEAPPPTSPEETRLKRRVTGLEKKVQHLEGQVVRARDAEKRLKRDLIERKGDLAETRMLAQRLRRELDDARRSIERGRSQAAPKIDATAIVEPIERSLKRLATGQKKIGHTVDKLKTAKPATTTSDKALRELTQKTEQLQKELTRTRSEQKAELTAIQKRLDAGLTANPAKKERKPRVKEVDKRVGVFVDVQNMYYGARKLKGKLDFDALMAAAVGDRRLIQSTAYVVESKEIDQSSFIARLQQKAIEVRRKTLRVRADGSTKGDWDMELALDILDAAAKLDVVVLVSGDGDFTSLVKRVKRMGPRVEVIAFPRTTAKSLLEAADRFVPLDRKFMIYKRLEKSS